MQQPESSYLLRNTPMQKPGERIMQILMAFGLNVKMK